MYRNFFGFSENPFEVTPDPSFLYLSRSHQEIFASLNYGIAERRGFIVILGEVGTGKTTLLTAILDQLDDNHKVAYIFNTDVSFEEMLGMALVDLEILRPEETLDKVDAIHLLNDFAIQQLTKGGNVVFIIDEAQNLNQRSLENLRLLSNLETPKHKLIQIVLSGQPELEKLLKQREMRQLSQRVSIKRYLEPLNEKETYEYIRHRLVKSNCTNPSLFNKPAQQLIWRYSQGIPRMINNLCDNALLVGYGLQKNRISSSIVEKAIKDLGWSPMPTRAAAPSSPEPSYQTKPSSFALRLAWAASLMFFGGIILLIGLILGGTQINFPGMHKTEQAGLSIESYRGDQPSLESGLNRETRQSAEQNRNLLEKDDQESIEVVRKTPDESPALAKNQSEPEPEQANIEEASVPEAAPSPVLAESTPDWDFSTISLNKFETDLWIPDLQVLNPQEEAAPQLEEPEEESPRIAETPRIPDLQVLNPQEEAAPQLEEPEEKSLQIAETPSVAEEQKQPPKQRTVVTKRGDTLTKIIIQNYGDYSKDKLQKVLRENPEIRNPDWILEGQVLNLPGLVVAKRGDTLTKIIIQNYGDYSEDKLQNVLRENPEIRNVDRILEGQVLDLPELMESPF